MLLLPTVLNSSAATPVAVLSLPVVFNWRASKPLAVLLLPVVLLRSAPAPLAVFSTPLVLNWSALKPVAVLKEPLLLPSASSPKKVLPPVAEQPSRQAARAAGARPKQARASGMSSKPSGQCERFTECCNWRVVVFIMPEHCFFALHTAITK